MKTVRGGWEPADGMERTAFTVVTNILTAIGYALILTGLFVLRGRPSAGGRACCGGYVDFSR